MNRGTQIALYAAITTLIVVGSLSVQAILLLNDSHRWVENTYDVLENLKEILLATEGEEATTRRFILSGNESVLDSRQAQESSAWKHEAAVRSLTVDNGVQQRRLPELESLLARQMKLERALTTLRRQRGSAAAAKETESAGSLQTSADIYRSVHAMQEEELRLLSLRDSRAQQLQTWTIRSLFCGILLSLSITVGGGWGILRANFRRDAAEKALQLSEERKFDSLLDAAPEAMLLTDSAGQVVRLNAQCEAAFGYRRDELVGKSAAEILSMGFLGQLETAYGLLLDQSPQVRIGKAFELEGRRKDGSTFPVEVMLNPLESAAGAVMIAALRDISKRRKAEERLAHTVAELRRSNADLEQYAYVTSHHLQEPLRTIASYAQLLAHRYQGRLDTDADEFIAYLVDGCKQMKQLMQDLLAYSSLRDGPDPGHLVSAESALQQAIATLSHSILESGATVTHDSLPNVEIHGGELVAMFQHLVENAIRFRQDIPPCVHISASNKDGREWVFTVKDNGIGIEHQYSEKIFILFQRLQVKKGNTGTGIGLAICRKIVERSGGRIWVESEPGSGATFCFSLPCPSA